MSNHDKYSEYLRMDHDQNCNNCTHLKRVKRPKNPHGFLYGTCGNKNMDRDNHPYKDTLLEWGEHVEVMTFHPNDYMGMECYSSRFTKAIAELERSI